MKYFGGCDVGSTYTKAVILDENGKMVADTTIKSKINSEQSAIAAMDEVIAKVPELKSSKDLAYLIGTGYGRNKVPFADENISEISCHAMGVHVTDPSVKAIIDIGGQDVKGISIDADGTVLGNYRKSHLPDGPGYTEKFYFSPGDTGFKVWKTKAGTIGVGICWDQWFPEAARSMALQGAEILLYPTAIGSEPHDAGLDSSAHWQRVMQGHAGANIMPLLASNRIGTEHGRAGTSITFYGSSFIADPTGAKVAEADRETETVLTASFDLDAIAHQRRSWGVFRDRRPELYGRLATLDGGAVG